MGLDTSHDAWHGSYSSFSRWREAVAQAAGFPPLRTMVGFGGSRSWDDVAPGDVRLIPLLHHSDCDGELTPAECRQITEALSSLLDRMPDPESWLHDATRAFAAGCRLAADLDEPLDFH